MNRIAALLCLALMPLAPLRAAVVSYVGEALDPDRGTLLYEEHHLVEYRDQAPLRRSVLYRCPDGRAFARKQVDYREDAYAPAFELVDARFGYREGMDRSGEEIEVFFRPQARKATQRASIDDAADLVADAGFDSFVRAHFERLRGGEPFDIDFVIPGRLEAMGFRIEPQREDDGVLQLRLSLRGVLGWFAPDIEARYDTDDGRLMRFTGLANIRSSPERNVVVDIVFPPQRHRRDADRALFAEAEAEPLEACELPIRGGA